MNVFELFAKIGLDDSEYKKGVKSAKGTFSGLATAIGKGVKTAAKMTGAAMVTGATAIAGLSKLAIDGYAEFEQVAGGAELMFGDAYATVAENAKKAYETVQMSQAEYLKQANGFATGLKTALGGNEQAAADLAHRIIQAEADVIAATGNTQENVQNAFNGIMKSNFTMLDNLQIGITPTKEGFQEVIDKVNEWNAANGKATSYQMDNLADMQSALVDYIDMVGMSGYAQMEASKTISGSIASMKAAWSNFVVGFADETADIEKLTENLVNSAVTAAGNIGDRLVQILPRIAEGAGQLITQAIPIISGLIEQTAPDLLSAAGTLLINLGDELINLAPELLNKIREMILSVDWMKVGDDVANGLAEIDWAGVISDLFQTIGLALGALGAFLVGLFRDAWNSVVNYMAEWVTKGEEMGMDTASAVLLGILTGLADLAIWVYENLIEPFIEGIIDGLTGVKDAGKQVVESIKNGIADAWNSLVEWFNDLWNGLFGNRSVSVGVNASDNVSGSHAGGLDYVPFDGYIAELHKGETVLTRSEADAYRRGNRGWNGVTIIQNIQAVAKTPVELAAATQSYFEQARWAF